MLVGQAIGEYDNRQHGYQWGIRVNSASFGEVIIVFWWCYVLWGGYMMEVHDFMENACSAIPNLAPNTLLLRKYNEKCRGQCVMTKMLISLLVSHFLILFLINNRQIIRKTSNVAKKC